MLHNSAAFAFTHCDRADLVISADILIMSCFVSVVGMRMGVDVDVGLGIIGGVGLHVWLWMLIGNAWPPEQDVSVSIKGS